MYKYIRLKRIKVNGKRAEIATRLSTGDMIEMYINDEFFTQPEYLYEFLGAPNNLDILFEDENILLLNKSVGLLAHPDENEYVDTLISRVKRYLYENGQYLPEDENSFAPALVNRIDRNTGGIVIAAKNAESLRVLNEKVKNREIRKFYLCVAHGYMKEKSGLLKGWLYKDVGKNKVFVYDSPREGCKEIATKYRVIAAAKDLSLLEIELLTGRTHQIRAHLAYIGHPLVGDGKYGRNAQNRVFGYKKQFLYSFKIIFDFKSGAGCLDYLNQRCFEVNGVWFAENFPDRILNSNQ
jgi:23S rRNA pseudouridine955/2504/2580 synthase